jgi:hypothetical protein
MYYVRLLLTFSGSCFSMSLLTFVCFLCQKLRIICRHFSLYFFFILLLLSFDGMNLNGMGIMGTTGKKIREYH